MPPKKKAGADGAKESDAVLDHLMAINRPVNAQMVIDALSAKDKSTKKTEVQKRLDALSADGRVNCKEYGKQKIYCISQSLFEAPTPELLKELDDQLGSLEEELEALKGDSEPLLATVKQLSSELTLAEATTELQAATAQIAEMKERLESLSKGVKLVSPQDRKKIEAAFRVASEAWKKRKRMCSEIIGTVCEGTGKRPKDFQEETGVETDESVGVKMDEVLKLSAPKRVAAGAGGGK